MITVYEVRHPTTNRLHIATILQSEANDVAGKIYKTTGVICNIDAYERESVVHPTSRVGSK